MGALGRQEVVDALEHRVAEIDRRLAETEDGDPDAQLPTSTAPVFGREMEQLTTAWLLAEQEWTRVLVKRLQNGEYVFG
jgi:hypothetical protein